MSAITKLGEESKLGTYNKKKRIEKKENIGSAERSLGVLAIWLQLLFMYLPIIGWGGALYFAISNNGTVFRKNLARATIINKTILLLVVLIVYFAINSLLRELVQTLNVILNDFKTTYTEVQNASSMLEDIVNFINKFILIN